MAPPPPSQRVARLCRRRAPAAAKQGGGRRRATVNLAWLLDLETAIVEMWHNDHLPVPPPDPVVPLSDDDRSDSPELPPESVPRRRRRQWRVMPRDFSQGRALNDENILHYYPLAKTQKSGGDRMSL
uniref:Uncharacterized protein n=1 Tax=Oryza glumipatula TaxID=40148 RepID=A0A0D9YQ99_9ORYZ